ncbi:MAG: hypothetical protein AAGC55_30620, partial [Myxococcota bacterium]
VRNCDWLFGIQAFVLMPLISCFLASALGVLLGVLCGRRRGLSNAAPYAVFVAAVLYAVWRFYAAPPVFSYNTFGGYFTGNLYDENVAFRAPFYWSRLYQIAALGTLLGMIAAWLDVPSMTVRWRAPRPSRRRLRSAALAVILAVILGWLHHSSGTLGFAVSAGDIQDQLGGRYDTEHFVIYYPPGGDIERDIHFIAEDHEFRYSQVVAALGAEPEQRITSFYFASAEDKFRLMGARRVYMAKPWRYEIYLNHRSFPHPILRHEIVHAVAADFGSPIFRVSAGTWAGLPVLFNVGLIEGIAVAADWPNHFDKPLTPHESVKALRELDMAPPAERLLGTGFFSFSTSRSYTMAGSLVRYLLDQYGAERLRQLYRNGGDFAAAYGRPQGELIAEWSAMIDRIELQPGAAETVRERFRRPG